MDGHTEVADRDLAMSRANITILLVCTVLACSACGDREAKKTDASSRESAFQKKRICAELGSQRLASDRRPREGESEGVRHGVRAEWCFSTGLNTCIYSSTDDLVVASDSNTMPVIVMSMQTTIDLLTNRTLISVERVKASRAVLEKYESRRSELFGKCQG
jgi:hypothetical protein